jgi:Kyakuja-Dileera-Zisupton transposase
MNALLASKACDVTGIVAIACARHGCFAPNSLVDLFLGEGQKNVDFGILKALLLTNFDPEQGLFLFYDIVCQYIVHFFDRIGIHLPPGLEVDAAIGLFHVHAHKDDCFFRFASTFIPGAGVVAGEILESLWSTLNKVSPSARTATLAYRAEILDDHATDSNHRKMLGIVSTLCKSYDKATDMHLHAQEYYNNLSAQAGLTAVSKWKADIEEAETNRRYNLPAMDIYAAKQEKPPERPAPAHDPAGVALERWMDLALTVEDKQLVFLIYFFSAYRKCISD